MAFSKGKVCNQHIPRAKGKRILMLHRRVKIKLVNRGFLHQKHPKSNSVTAEIDLHVLLCKKIPGIMKTAPKNHFEKF